MSTMQSELSIFNKFNFVRKPVGVKFLIQRPDGIHQLEKSLAFCEMLKEAQETDPFYAAKDNFECKVGHLILGMEESDELFESGAVGPMLGIFDEPRNNRRIYHHIPVLSKNTVQYVAFSSLDKLTFEPDVFIVMADIRQADIILRAVTYSTGKMWNSKSTLVVGCSWLYIYPFVSGELNYLITGLQHGMKARQLFPEGMFLISIPYDLLPVIIKNLHTIKWELPQYHKGKEAHVQNMKRIVSELSGENR